LQRDAEVLASPQRKHLDANVIEKAGQTLRAAWAPEIDSPACAAAHRLPRVLGPIKQIMGDDIYLYQSRLNYKRAHMGDVFQWHQDYQSWLMDGVPGGGHRDILSVLIMLDDTYDKSCGPLEFLAGSHKLGAIPPVYDTETTSYALHIVTDDLVERQANLLRGPLKCIETVWQAKSGGQDGSINAGGLYERLPRLGRAPCWRWCARICPIRFPGFQPRCRTAPRL